MGIERLTVSLISLVNLSLQVETDVVIFSFKVTLKLFTDAFLMYNTFFIVNIKKLYLLRLYNKKSGNFPAFSK